MTSVPLTEARADFFDMVERAAAGERITLTSRGVSRATLGPIVSDDHQPHGLTADQAREIFNHHQMDPGAWDAIRRPGDTIGEDGLG
jgi:prevent-host-death family protein